MTHRIVPEPEVFLSIAFDILPAWAEAVGAAPYGRPAPDRVGGQSGRNGKDGYDV
jgi:hypothetical protein